ncbi:MAG: GNAT family N-acetyltransferase [Patescibacteria group bacterium]
MVTKLSLPFTKVILKLWDYLLANRGELFPFETPAWHTLWLKTFLHYPEELYFLSADDKAIAPFIRNGNTVSFSGGKEISDYMDIVCPDEEIHDVWPKILSYLRDDAIQTLALSNIAENSKTYEFFTSLQSSSPDSVTMQKDDTTPILSLPDSWDEYLTSLDRKSRHELRRKMKRFEEMYGIDSLSIRSSDEASQLLFLMKKDSNKNAFLTDSMESFFNSLSSAFHSQFEVTTLFVSDTPAASIAGFNSQNSYLLYNSGFDEKQFSGAGFYLKSKSIALAIEKNIKTYNFLQGNERYKYELGGKDLAIYTITVDILKY